MAAASPQESLVLGRYQLGSRIGAGAVGSVFRAVDTRSGQAVVAKFFDGQEDGFPPWASEMRLVLRFRHSNIVNCLDTGFDEQSHLWVLIFELAAGGSLRRALVAGQAFAARQTARLLLDISSALAYAHAQGVVHRDVKPENIVARANGNDTAWLLTDFGAGRFLAAGQLARSLAGSAEYMAPEVCNQAATAISDQFSLGIVGMELVSGQRPSHLLRAEVADSLRERPGLSGIIGRLAASEPARRFAGMVEVVTALQRELKEMNTGGDTVDLLRPYLREQHALSEDALLRLIEEWNQQGSFLDFLVGKNLLPRSAARTLEAVRKGYLNLPIEAVLGLTGKRPALVDASPTPIEEVVVAEPAKSRLLVKPAAGLRVGRYILQEQLGEGASATVFRAFNETLNIPVAIKLFAPLDGAADPEAPQRFRREAQTLVRLEHPHIVRILDADIDGPFPYIVMEYVGETTIETLINNLGKLPAQRIIQIGLAVADALETAWKAGLLHRDVKPSNILERKDGHIKLVDFGIVARRLPEGGLSDPQAAQGIISGTPLYIAPEQAMRPDSIDFRADMYGLGATLYHAAVGRPPLVRATAYDTMMAHIHDEPVPIQQLDPSFDAQLASAIHRMLRKRPEDRFGSWAEVRAALADKPGQSSAVTPVRLVTPESPPSPSAPPPHTLKRPSLTVLRERQLGRWAALPRSRQRALAGGSLLVLLLTLIGIWLGGRP